MRIIVTGATGNVGTSVLAALRDSEQVDEIVGIARRLPGGEGAKTSWISADVTSTDLVPIFRGADAVIHLAWAIQPSRDGQTLERVNVAGSRRVFDAVAAAGVPKLVHASSVGAYSRGPKDQAVDEDWPIGATPTSFYSRHKVEVERILSAFEAENPEVAVVRLRPALIFKGDSATEIRRLFAGPFLPTFLLRPALIPFVPNIPRLRFQAVHSLDVGRAYALAVTGDAAGAFNLAADPPIGHTEMAEMLGARAVPMRAGLVRALAEVTWRLRLQPTPPGWFDMALNVPLMSSDRAHRLLGWEPQHSATEALQELMAGMREGRGGETPPLREDGVSSRVDEVRTGVGARAYSED